MNLLSSPLRRRNFVLASLMGGIAWLGSSLTHRAAAQEKASLIAKRVERVPETPDDGLWPTADRLEVPLAPQAVIKPRTYEAGVKEVTVRAFYDDERVALLLEWKDAARDIAIHGVTSFRDAIALEFPSNPANGIPYFAMGEPNKPVTIYQWKADWEFARDQDVGDRFAGMAVDWYPYSGTAAGAIAKVADYGRREAEKAFHTSWWSGSSLGNLELQARTPIEKLEAEGFGTIRAVAPDRQDASGKALWKDGSWKVVISLPRAQGTFGFEPGMTVPIAFAAWDGAKGERGGQKAVSTWYFLSLEQPVGAIAYVGPVLALVGAFAAQAWGLRLLRRKAGRAEGEGA